jgi:signal transduction histidine kinase
MSKSDKNIKKSEISEPQNKKTGEETQSNILKMINCPTLLTGMSHEVRTHMNSIVAFSFLLNNNGFNENEKEEFSNHILSSCEQLMHLFDNFLDSAIIDAGNSKTDLRKCKMSDILDDLLAEFRVILKREDHKELVLVLENQLSDKAEFYIDSNRIARIIRSLFQNALSNTDSGYIKLGYYFRDSNLVCYILDSGHGYRKCKEFLQTENLNDSLSRHFDTSTAINLTLARKLISLMGGTVWIETNGPEGTGMYFSVPVKEAYKTTIISNKYLNSKMTI